MAMPLSCLCASVLIGHPQSVSVLWGLYYLNGVGLRRLSRLTSLKCVINWFLLLNCTLVNISCNPSSGNLKQVKDCSSASYYPNNLEDMMLHKYLLLALRASE